MSKRVKATVISALLVMGCASPSDTQESSEVLNPNMEPRQVMEKADRADSKLGSYRMVSHENYQTDEQKESSSETVYLEFVENILYSVSEFSGGYFQISRAVLDNENRHSADGSSMKVREGANAVFNPDFSAQGVFEMTSDHKVQDYISIPSNALLSSNHYKVISADENEMSIEVSGMPLAEQLPEGASSVMVFVFDQNLHLTEMEVLESDNEKNYSFTSKREFSLFNEKKINTDAIDSWLQEAAGKSASELPAAKVEQFLLS